MKNSIKNSTLLVCIKLKMMKLEYFWHIARRDGGNLEKQSMEESVAGGVGRQKLTARCT